FDLAPGVRKVYDELEEDFFTLIDGGAVTAANAAVASGKCRQVASGGIYSSEAPVMNGYVQALLRNRETIHLHDDKTDLVEDLAEELQGQPLLVAYEFNHDLERLLARFGKGTPVIGGGTSSKRAAEIERAWNGGDLPILLGHPQSVGHGLNLQGGSGCHVCWYTPTWNLELYDQLNGRLRRQGSRAARMFVHLLMARDTVDEVVYAALKSKARGQNALLDAMKKMRRR